MSYETRNRVKEKYRPDEVSIVIEEVLLTKTKIRKGFSWDWIFPRCTRCLVNVMLLVCVTLLLQAFILLWKN